MPVYPLLKTRNYFISSEGFVFKIENGKEVRVQPYQTKKSKEVCVFIDKKPYNLLHLMIQHFIGNLKITDKLKFTITKDLTIPLNSIIIKPALGKVGGLTPEQEAEMFKYRCSFKANAANSRCEHKLTTVQVYTTLLIHEFKCIYCGEKIKPTNWHLDHFTAVSKGGRNILENIVPSCAECNMMKGAMDGQQLFVRCIRILKNYMFRDSPLYEWPIRDLKDYLNKVNQYEEKQAS
jgi:hypothetical protein